MRALPSLLNTGDSLKARLALPPLDDGEAYASGSLALRLVDDTDDVRRTYAGEIDGDAIVFTIAATGTDGTGNFADGIWRYQITATGNAGSVLTLESSILDVRDALSPRLSINARIVKILECTIETKLTGRGDVIEYTIGDRDLKTMSLEELTTTLSRYREMASRERRPRQYWYRG